MSTDLLSRDELVESVMPLVRRMARTVARGNTAIDVDDLISEGYIGAIQAAENFDPARGFAFTTFAGHRIRGAMRDYLRSLDHLSRKDRKELPDDDFRKSPPMRLDAPLGEGGTLADLLPGDDEFEEAICDNLAAHWAVAQLDGAEYDVVVGHHWYGKTLAQLGVEMGVTESRCCQIEAAAVHRLRMAFIEAGISVNTTLDAVRDTVRRRGRATPREGAALLQGLDSLWGGL